MISLDSSLEFLKLNLPSFYLVRFLLENLDREKENENLFFNRLTRGVFDSEFYNTSYITDLGLRRTTEPTIYFLKQARLFFSSSSARLFHYPLPYHDQTMQKVGKQLNLLFNTAPFDFNGFVRENLNHPQLINDVVKYYADIFGNWDDADSISQSVLCVFEHLPQDRDTAYLLSNCGNLLSHIGNPLCRKAYQLAYSLQCDPYHKFTNQFRITVADIKRLHQSKNILPSINQTKLAAREFGESTSNGQDTRFCSGLIDNLEALYHLKNKDMDNAEKCIHRAWSTVSNIPNDTISIEKDIANRYRIQIIENLAFFSGFTSTWERSIPIFCEAVSLSRHTTHPNSLAEALSLLGYALIQSKQPKKAVDCLEEADRIRSDSVGILKAQEVRKMLAVAYEDAGDDKGAQHWVEKLLIYDNENRENIEEG